MVVEKTVSSRERVLEKKNGCKYADMLDQGTRVLGGRRRSEKGMSARKYHAYERGRSVLHL